MFFLTFLMTISSLWIFDPNETMSFSKSAIWLNCSIYGNYFVRSRKHRSAAFFGQVGDRLGRDRDRTIAIVLVTSEETGKEAICEAKTG